MAKKLAFLGIANKLFSNVAVANRAFHVRQIFQEKAIGIEFQVDSADKIHLQEI